MVERKGGREKEKYPKPKTEDQRVKTSDYVDSFREVLLSLLTPRSSSSRRAHCVLNRVPMDMASLERGEEASLPLEERGRCESGWHLEPRARASSSAIWTGRWYGDRRCFLVGRGLTLYDLGCSWEEAGVEAWVDGEYGE